MVVWKDLGNVEKRWDRGSQGCVGYGSDRTDPLFPHTGPGAYGREWLPVVVVAGVPYPTNGRRRRRRRRRVVGTDSRITSSIDEPHVGQAGRGPPSLPLTYPRPPPRGLGRPPRRRLWVYPFPRSSGVSRL